MFNLLEKFLPPADKVFYNCFESSAEICYQTAQLFNEITHSGFTPEHVEKAKNLKAQSRKLSKETLYHLNATFVTPIDREDIQHVALLLKKITKKIVRACLNYDVYKITEYNDTLKLQSELLVSATEELKYVISLLRKISMIKEITEAHHRMKEIEHKGDDAIHVAMVDLFSGKYDALTVMKFRDIYKGIETAMDTCCSVSDTVLNIALKHS